MRGRQCGARFEQCIGVNPELGELRLGLDLRLGEMPLVRLRDVLDLCLAPSELDGGIAVLLFGAGSDNLQLVDMQNGDRHVRAVILEDPGHAQLLRQ